MKPWKFKMIIQILIHLSASTEDPFVRNSTLLFNSMVDTGEDILNISLANISQPTGNEIRARSHNFPANIPNKTLDRIRPCEMPRRISKEEKFYLCRNLRATLASYTRNTQKLVRNMMERQQQSLDDLAKQMSELMNRVHFLNSELLRTDIHQFPTRPVQSHGFDCTDIKDTVGSLSRAPSGIYIIQPKGADYPFEVFCEMDLLDSGWTVIQKRIDGTIEFVRTWAEYMDGFGDLGGEFWLGLRNVFHIVNQKNVKFKLLVIFESDDETTAYASYEDFYIADESDQFKLHLGHFSGTAGDAFRGSGTQDDENGMPFSTFDRDNDGCNPQCNIQGHLVDSCSVHHNNTGWWFNQCGLANLNEAHFVTEKSFISYIRWETWKLNGAPIRIKSVSMNLLRSRNYHL